MTYRETLLDNYDRAKRNLDKYRAKYVNVFTGEQSLVNELNEAHAAITNEAHLFPEGWSNDSFRVIVVMASRTTVLPTILDECPWLKEEPTVTKVVVTVDKDEISKLLRAGRLDPVTVAKHTEITPLTPRVSIRPVIA